MSLFWRRADLKKVNPGTKLPADATDWIAVSGGIGFAAAAGSDWTNAAFADPLRYRRDASGRVYLKGTIAKSDSPVQFLGSPVVTMPADFRMSGSLVQFSTCYSGQSSSAGLSVVTIWGEGSVLAGQIRFTGYGGTNAVGLCVIDLSYLAGG